MLKLILVFVGGTMVGGLIGVVTMCLMITAGNADRNNEQ